MGVPKFYRWISERYPSLSEVVKEYQIPEFDNLYLDMNGIIHVCSHPDDNNPHFRITEEKIFSDISNYIEGLFRIIKPKKVFFMAVDGVAPRAKMNQQRARRYRSAQEAEDKIKEALDKGEILPTEERFDSNCITPGTPFMERLHNYLQYFVVRKEATDPLWNNVRVILSGHQTPGEGEHKIMDFIRTEKASLDFNVNTCHCMYGLDADLMMLGLTTHETHFSLLREEVQFGKQSSKKARSNSFEQTTFHLLHLTLMREYIEHEFSILKSLPFYSLESIIDDWVLMGFLVGNDFIPHLPNMHIHQGCLPILWKAYKEILPHLDGFLNEGGTLNLARFEKYLGALSTFDYEQYSEQYSDLKWLKGKSKGKETYEWDDSIQSKIIERIGKMAQIPTAEELSSIATMDDEKFQKQLDEEKIDGLTALDEYELDMSQLDELPKNCCEPTSGEKFFSSDPDANKAFFEEFRLHKNSYYIEKMKYEYVSREVLQDQAECYVTGLQWILSYYYDGIQSWGWFYPHHYAPYLSDVQNICNLVITFERGQPFLPFQQLMAVLPPASKAHIPEVYHSLMTETNSPVIDFYPSTFELDMNGKQQEWEAVVLIPFIEEARLLHAMDSLTSRLSLSEQRRNRHGPHFQFEYTEVPQGSYLSPQPENFPTIINHHSIISEKDIESYHLPPSKLRKGLCEGVQLDVLFPGFPSLKHIPHTGSLSQNGVKVFQQPSRGDNMILKIVQNQERPDIEHVASQILGKPIHVGWPHLEEALIVAVLSREFKYFLKSGRIQYTALNEAEYAQYSANIMNLTEKYSNRYGVDVGQSEIIVHGRQLTGRRYVVGATAQITLDKQYANSFSAFLYQTCVQNISVHCPSFIQYQTIDDVYPVGSEAFMIGNPCYGCKGKILSVDNKTGRIKLEFTVVQEPDVSWVAKENRMYNFQPSSMMSRNLGISSHLFSRLTGVVMVNEGSQDNSKKKVNIGLNLKSNKANLQTSGFTSRDDSNTWKYSAKCADEIQLYIERFPEVVEYLATRQQEDSYYENKVFERNSSHNLQLLLEFLKSLPSHSAERVPCGSIYVSTDCKDKIEKTILDMKNNPKVKKRKRMNVMPHLLYKCFDVHDTSFPNPNAEQLMLFDRVVVVRNNYPVPYSYRGTVVGKSPGVKERDVMYEILFDEEFAGGGLSGLNRMCMYRLPPWALISLPQSSNTPSLSSLPVQSPQAWDQGNNALNFFSPKWDQSASEKSNAQSQRRTAVQNSREPVEQTKGKEEKVQSRTWNNSSYGHGGKYDEFTATYSRQLFHQFDDNGKSSQSPPKSVPRSMQPPSAEDFSTVWKELTTKSNSSPGKITSLAEAAMALPISPGTAGGSFKTPTSEQGLEEWTSCRNNDHKLERDSMKGRSNNQNGKSPRKKGWEDKPSKKRTPKDKGFKSPRKKQIQAHHGSDQKGSDGDPNGTENKRLDCEEATIEDTTATLKRMLNLTDVLNSPAENAAATVSTSPSRRYGKQLSVDELFSAASTQQQQISGAATLSKEIPPLMKDPKVSELESEFFRLGHGKPQIIIEQFSGHFSAQVTLPSGEVVKGSNVSNVEFARESVASKALNNLRSHENHQPNSAFTVVGDSRMPLIVPQQYSPLRPPLFNHMWASRPFPFPRNIPVFPVQANFSPQPHNIRILKRNESTGNRLGNPFVPLQVSLKQKTPKKGQESVEERKEAADTMPPKPISQNDLGTKHDVHASVAAAEGPKKYPDERKARSHSKRKLKIAATLGKSN